MPYYDYAAQSAKTLQALAKDGQAVAVLPIGAVEQHGPHLPVGTDYLCAEASARMAMEEIRSDQVFFLLPVLSYALSVEHIHVPGTLTLSAQTLIQVISEIGESLLRLGVKKLVFVNCHGGNDSAIQIAGRILRAKDMKVYMVNGNAIRNSLGAQESDIHADRIETSMMLALYPQMVREDEITPTLSDSIERWHSAADCQGDLISFWCIEDISVDGVVGDPALASKEFGAEFLQKQSKRIAAAIELASRL